MATLLSPSAKQQFFDSAGNPAAGFKLWTYAANSTTPQATFTSRAGNVANANPIILDARGEATIYLDPSLIYDYELRTAADALVWLREDVTAQTGDLLLRSDLGTADTDKGSTLVAFKRAGSGTVARTLQSKLEETVSILDFGAVMNGTTDDTAALTAAIAYLTTKGGGTVEFPTGSCRITSQFILTVPIKLRGKGNGYIANAGFPATTGTRLLYDGGSTGFIAFSNVNFGSFGVEDMYLDANSKATVGLIVQDSVGGSFRNVTVRNYTNKGVHFNSTATYASNTNSWHKVDGMVVESAVSGVAEAIRFSGFTGMGNACHIKLTSLKITHTGTAHGIVLGGCDNITFLGETFIYRAPGGTGRGVFIDTAEHTGFPMSNTFYHLQAGDGGFYQASSNGTPYHTAQIYCYAMDNGQPPIVAPAGQVSGMTGTGQLFGLTSFGRSAGSNFHFTYSYTAGAASRVVAFPGANEPDANYEVIIIPGQQVSLPMWTTSRTTTGFTMNFSADPGGTVALRFLIVRL